jgi:RimJ/RimL family protein N-acetyltransferase
MSLIFRPVQQQDADHILSWCYEPPYTLYNPEQEDWLWLLNPASHYYAVVREPDDLLGVCCLGREAQVRGGDYSREEALDLGMALRPDLLGQSLGIGVARELLSFAYQVKQPALFRATVATFNQRALCLCRRLGFRSIRTFCATTPTGEHEFVVLLRAGKD